MENEQTGNSSVMRPSISKRLFDSLVQELSLECSRVVLDNILPGEFLEKASKIVVSLKALQMVGPEEFMALYTKGQLDEVMKRNIGNLPEQYEPDPEPEQ